MGCHFLLGIFPIQGLSLGLWRCRQTLYRLSHQEGDSEQCLWLLFRPQETWRLGSRKMVGVDEGLGLSRGSDGLHVAKSSSSLTSWQHVTWLTTVSSLVPFSFSLRDHPTPTPRPQVCFLCRILSLSVLEAPGSSVGPVLSSPWPW